MLSGKNTVPVFLALFAVLLLAGCQAQTGDTADETIVGGETAGDEADDSGSVETGSDKGTISFGLPPWPGVTVKTAVVKQILEEKGYTVESNELDAGIVYASLAQGDLDVLLAGWLPVTHKDYWEQHGDNLEKVRVNVDETWLGLAVPTYVYEDGVTSINDLNENVDLFDGQIIGIEPGAGIMQSTEEVMDTYSLDDYELVSSSTPSMMAEVDASVRQEEPVVFTIWEPHSAFAKFDIKKLDDPEEIYGGGDVVYTITRDGFSDEYPEVYSFLENFEVTPDTQSEWILEYSDKEREPEAVAEEWISNNQDKVNQWWPES
ncbi:MAG: glycine betaine ABC transporter substrate-binding protein [Candidatus Woesearchaeota archaeon]